MFELTMLIAGVIWPIDSVLFHDMYLCLHVFYILFVLSVQ